MRDITVDESSGSGSQGGGAVLCSISTVAAASAEWKVAASEVMLVVLWLLKLGLKKDGMFLLFCATTETDVSWALDWLVISVRPL